MKNVHLLPTDKPSRLCFRNYYFINKNNIGTYSNVEFKNIYITSGEEIKEGDWVLSKLNEVILFGRSYSEKFYKKIILTTDQDLIKDGVQAIDDDIENRIFWIDSAKWQAERSFSEEQVIELLEYVRTNFYDTGKHWHQEPDKDISSKELIEQFKNNVAHLRKGFKFCAKWQAEIMYSREDIENIWNEFVKELPPINNGSSSDFLVYLKQFKKK